MEVKKLNMNVVREKKLLKFRIEMKGLSKIAAVLLFILIILIAFFAAWFTGLLPFQQPQQAKTSLSVKEKLTKLVQNNPIENPLVPVYFHYLDRYFNGLSEDAFDLAVAGVMEGVPQDVRDLVVGMLDKYKEHADILTPIIPSDYADLELSETVDASDFVDALQEASMAEIASAHFPRAGLRRPPLPGGEFAPVAWIRLVNSYLEEDDPVRIRPGESVTLEGYNFYDTNLKVKISSETYYKELSGFGEVFVDGDTVTPIDAPYTNVKDKIYFSLPRDIPPGLYNLILELPSPAGGSDYCYSNYRDILVPGPSGEKYTVRAQTIYCEDETNPESAVLWNLQDETFFSFIVNSGDRIWSFDTDLHDFDDGTSTPLQPAESVVFGPDNGLYAEVSTQLEIMVVGYEIDSGDVEAAKNVIKDATRLAEAILAVTGQGVWIPVAEAAGQLLQTIVGLFDNTVMVGDDIIRWTEDDLYFLTAIPRSQQYSVPYVELQRHLGSVKKDINIGGYAISVVSYSQPSGIEVRIPIGGNYKFSIVPEYNARSFTVWRGYQNNDEPSQYFVLFEVQRQG